MKYPKFLNNNTNLIFIAPSFGCVIEPYKSRLIKAYDVFKEAGLNPTYGPNVFNDGGVRSNTKEICVKEFMDGYVSNNQLLLSVGGGNLMYELLDLIDFEKIKLLEPKWFMGYSDNTNLTFTLTTLCDIATIYGGCAPEFGTTKLYASQLDAISLIKGEKLKFIGYPKYELESIKDENNPLAAYNLTEDKILTCYPDKIEMEGRLIGGCTDSLLSLIGTPYDKVHEFSQKYENDGLIWFLESCDLTAWQLRLAILQMKRHGWFKNTKGFIFGRSLLINDKFFDIDMHNAIYDVLKDLNVPIILDADFGHIKPQLPIICGSYAKVKANKNIEIEYILK